MLFGLGIYLSFSSSLTALFSLTQKYVSCSQIECSLRSVCRFLSNRKQCMSKHHQLPSTADESVCVMSTAPHGLKGRYFSVITWLLHTIHYLCPLFTEPQGRFIPTLSFVHLLWYHVSSALIGLKTTSQLMNSPSFHHTVSTRDFLSEAWTLSLFIKGCKMPSYTPERQTFTARVLKNRWIGWWIHTFKVHIC